MIRTAFASLSAGRPMAATFAVGLGVMTLSLAALAPAHADQNLAAPSQTVRTTLTALAAADAVTPFATAYMTANETAAILPTSSAAMKAETANAMASVRTASVRRAEPVYLDRRAAYRPVRDPFFLAVGIAY